MDWCSHTDRCHRNRIEDSLVIHKLTNIVMPMMGLGVLVLTFLQYPLMGILLIIWSAAVVINLRCIKKE